MGLIAAAALLGAALPAYGSNGKCKFQAQGLSMSFGALDPRSGSTVTVAVSATSLNADNAGDCTVGTMTISADNGIHFSGSRRLSNGTDFIAYTLVGLPYSRSGPGNNSYAPFTFNGTISGSAYANASAGAYSDSVVISVNP